MARISAKGPFRNGLFFAVLFCFLAFSGGSPGWASPIELQTTRVALKPQEPGERRVGDLLYRGGLVLASSDRRFGGLSGLLVQPDGNRLLAITDIGSWVRIGLDYRDGDLVGAHDAEIGPMRDLAGRPMQGKEADAESLAPLSGHGIEGDLAVGFEGNSRIWAYPFGRAGFDAVPSVFPTPQAVRHVRFNEGLEGMAQLPDGRLLAVTEATLDSAGNMIGWSLGTKGSEPLSYKRRGNYSLSDLTALPDGDILALERRYSPLVGVFMRLRRIPAADIKPRAVLQGALLAELGPGYSIDNMEGVSARRGPEGETLIYVISDDNFNPFERTVLLMFELKGSRSAQPRPR